MVMEAESQAAATAEAMASLRVVAVRLGHGVEHLDLRPTDATGALKLVARGLELPWASARSTAQAGVRAGRTEARSGTGAPGRDHISSVALVEGLCERLNDFDWSARRDGTRLRLIEGYFGTVRKVGRTQLDMSVRLWADTANVSRTTVGRWDQTLEPWVVPVRRHHNLSGRAIEWVVGCAPVADKWDKPRPEPAARPAADAGGRRGPIRPVEPGSALDPAADWCYGRPSLRTIYRWLDFDARSEFTVTEAMAGTGHCRDTVRRGLLTMEPLGFVEGTGRLTWRPADPDGDPVALASVRQVSKERAARYAREQWRHHSGLELDPETGELAPAERAVSSEEITRLGSVAPRSWLDSPAQVTGSRSII